MDGLSAPPGALLPAREQGLPQCYQSPSLCRQEARLSRSPWWHQTSIAPLANSAGQEYRWEGPDKQPSGAHGTFTTINWVSKDLTKS